MIINNTIRNTSTNRLQQKLRDAVMLSLDVRIISSTAASTHPQRAAPSLVEPSHAG